MKTLLMTKRMIEDEYGLNADDVDRAVAAGLLTVYDGPAVNSWTKYFRADVEQLVQNRGGDLLKRLDVEQQYGVTRHQIVTAIEAGDLKPYDGPLQKRYHQFLRSEVERWAQTA